MLIRNGEVSEWSKVHAWKACEVQASAGPNPVLSAKSELYELQVCAIFLCF